MRNTRYLYRGANQHPYLYATHRSGERDGEDIPMWMPIAGSHLPHTYNVCFFYMDA